MSTPKSERTRTAIRDAAIASFRQRGFDATTIRLLADELSMSVGSAYYHFPSKSHLIQELYVQVQADHRAVLAPLLAREAKLAPRLKAFLQTGLDQLEPFGDHASEFALAALSPGSDASPLSSESGPARDSVIALLRETVEGSSDRLPSEIAQLAPEALYRIYLALTLAWVQDTSPGRERTRRLIDNGIRLLSVALPALRLPPVRRAILPLMADVAKLGE
ncbi:TetR family transcriptional regulator [Microbacterium sp. ZW T5_56]|uniref:TetR/AcrR family transcriptional regulator n=1 Tax=Microbacterium sp. ZW T5_56 TaxID=3378081 RepID=UPI0038551C36